MTAGSVARNDADARSGRHRRPSREPAGPSDGATTGADVTVGTVGTVGAEGPDVVDGRTRLLDTAEQLLDEHGLDGVSLRTVASAAGHRNPSAVHYHFGDREQLLLAVFERRHQPIEARRSALVEELERHPDPSSRDVLAAALLPLADQLRTEGGRRYLRLLLQGSVHPSFYDRTALASSPTLARVAARLLADVAHLPEDVRIHRLRIALGLALYAMADQARLIDTPRPPRPVLDHDTFCNGLLDAVLGAIRA